MSLNFCVSTRNIYLNLNGVLQFLRIFPEKFMNYQIFDISTSFVAHCDEKLGGHNCAPLPHLVVNSECELKDYVLVSIEVAHSMIHTSNLQKNDMQEGGADSNRITMRVICQNFPKHHDGLP